MHRAACALVGMTVLVLCMLAGSVLAGSAKLRVCSDPNNLPFSNAHREGFENRIVELVAHDLRREVEHVWRPSAADL